MNKIKRSKKVKNFQNIVGILLTIEFSSVIISTVSTLVTSLLILRIYFAILGYIKKVSE